MCMCVCHLVEIGCWFGLPDTIEVLHIDQLVVQCKASISHPVLRPLSHMWEVPQSLIPIAQHIDTGWREKKRSHDLYIQFFIVMIHSVLG